MKRLGLLAAALFTASVSMAFQFRSELKGGVWVLEFYHPGGESPAKFPGMADLSFRFGWSNIAYELALNVHAYPGNTRVNVISFDNRLPVYFTPTPLRLYAAPTASLAHTREIYPFGGDVYEIIGNDYGFGGVVGFFVPAADGGSYVDISYGYQGTILEQEGGHSFFASRRVLRGKGVVGVSSHVGFAAEAGYIEEGWMYGFYNYADDLLSSVETEYLGSPFALVGVALFY